MEDQLVIQSSAAQGPQNVSEYYERGWVFLTQGEFSQAEADFRQAILRNSRFAEGYYGLGLALKLQKRIPESRTAFEKALSYLGKDAVALDRTRITMLRRLTEDHLKILDGIS